MNAYGTRQRAAVVVHMLLAVLVIGLVVPIDQASAAPADPTAATGTNGDDDSAGDDDPALADDASQTRAPEKAAMQSASSDPTSQAEIVPLTPARLLDTRTENRRLDVGGQIELAVANRGGVPATGVVSAVLNVTAVDAVAEGFITVYPCGERPLASSLNFGPTITATANEIIAKLSSSGSTCLFSSQPIDLVVDVTGYVPISSSVASLTPARLLDTRTESRRLDVGGQIELAVANRGGVPAAGIGSAVLNVTAVDAVAEGFITVYPCGERPLASSLNFGPTITATANEIIAKLSSSGSTCLFSSQPIDLVVDVTGYVPISSSVASLTPARLLDTRTESRRLDVGGQIELAVANRGGVPAAGIGSAVLNVTAVDAVAEGFITVYPCGERPLASSLNFGPTITATANEIIAKLSLIGSTCLFSSQPIDLVVDVTGYVPASTPTPVIEIPQSLTPGWHVVPDTVLLTAPNQTEYLQLIDIDLHGQPTGRAVPAGTTIVSNTDAGIDAMVDATGLITVTGGGTVGEEIAKIEIEGNTVGPIWLTSARLQPGVQEIDDSTVVFPTADNNDPAPFAKAELVARVSAPITPDAVVITGTVIPYVLAGAPPATGSLIVATGANPLMGRVVERPGLPTLQRDGHSLVSVQLVAMNDIYYALQSGISPADLQTFGIDHVDSHSLRDLHAVASRLVEVEEPAGGSPCKAEGGATAGFEVKLLNAKFDLSGRGAGVEVSIDLGEQQGLIAEFGFGGSIEFTPQAKIQAAAVGKVSCELADVEVPVPVAPPVQPFLTSEILARLVIEVEAKAAVGPAITAGLKCTYSFSLVVGFRWTSLRGFQKVNEAEQVPLACELQGDISDSYNAAGIPVSAELAATGKIENSLALRVGGTSAELFGKWLDIPDLGLVKGLTGSIGLKGGIVLENSASVLANSASASGVTVSITSALSLNLDAFDVFTYNVLGIRIGFSFDIVSFEFPVATPLATAAVDHAEATIDGEVQRSPIEVEVGDAVDFKVVTKESAATLTLLPDSAKTYQKVGADYRVSQAWDWQASGYTLTAHRTITKEFCDEVGTGMSFAVIGSTALGPVSVPDWSGTFEVKCGHKISFDPAAVFLTKQRPSATVTMKQSGFGGDAWELVPDAPMPAGYDVTFSERSGTFAPKGPGDNDGKVDLELDRICGADADDLGYAIYRAKVKGVATDGIVEVTVDCRDAYIRGPGQVTVPTQYSVDTDGPTDDNWTGPGVPGGGFLRGRTSTSTKQSELSSFIADRGSPPCGVTWPEWSTTTQISSSTRGSDDLIVVFPAKTGPPEPCTPDPCPPSPEHPDLHAAASPPCPPPPPCEGCGGGAGFHGDPHVLSFDGVSYDAQVLGEYVMAESADHSIRIVNRTERATSAVASPFKPTSTTAISIEAAGHKIEQYVRPFATYVDGKSVDLPNHVSTSIGDGISISVDDDETTITTPTLVVRTSTFHNVMFGILFGLNEQIDVRNDGSLTGLLGTNDGNPANDLRLRDGSSITLAQALEHDTALYALTDSWRITDKAESPFSMSYSGFADANEPRPDSAALAPFRAQALAMLGGLSAICAGSFQDGARIIDILAIELAIGMVPEDLGQYSCDFGVNGTVQLQAPSTPVLGAVVTVDAPGLSPCTTTANPSGRYTCTLHPDPAEIGDGSSVHYPLPITVDVAAPGSSTTVATASGQFAVRPAFGARVDKTIDVTVAAGVVPTLDLTALLTQYGIARAGSVALQLEGRDAAGDVVLSTRVAPTRIVPGTFTSRVVVPPSMVSLTVTWDVGLAGDTRPSAIVTGFGAGNNAKTVTLDHSPSTIDITGVARYNGSTPHPFSIGIAAVLPGGGPWHDNAWISTFGADGAYTTRVVLPEGATNVTLQARLGDNRNAFVTEVVSAPATGVATVTFDVIVTAPILHVTGTLVLNGTPVPTATYMNVIVTRSGGASYSIRRLMPANPTGAFEQTVELPSDATTAKVTAEIGAAASDFPSVTVNPLAGGVDEVPLDAAISAPRVDVAGVITASGVPVRNVVTFRVQATTPTALDTTVSVQPANDGTYSFSTQLPVGATTATITALVGFSQAEYQHVTPVGLVAGSNTVAFNPSFVAVVVRVSGTLKDHGVTLLTRRFVQIRALDAVNATLSTNTVLEYPAPDGTFSFDHYLPTTAKGVELNAVLSEHGFDARYVRATSLTAGLNTVTLDDDYDPPVMRLSGKFTSGGVAVGGSQYIDVFATVQLPTGGTATTTTTVRPFLDLALGTYTVDVTLPRQAISADLAARIGPDPADYPTKHIASIDPDLTLVTFDGDIPIPVAVDFNAALTGTSAPYTAATSFVFRAYDAVGAVVTSTTRSATPDSDGTVRAQLEFDAVVTRVEVDWRVGIAGEAPITQTFTSLHPGDNLVLFRATHAPAVVDLHGTVQLNGVTYTKSLTLDLIAQNGTPNPYTKSITVTPNTSTGAIAWNLTLPRNATSVIITANLGQTLETVPTTTFAALVPGANSGNLNIALIGPNLLVSGTMKIGTAAPTGPVAVDLIASGPGHSSFTVSVQTNPAAGTGAYSFAAVLPSWATAAELVAEIGPSNASWVHQSVSSLVTGDQTITFNAQIAEQQLDFTGTVTIGPDPWPASLDLNISGTQLGGGTFNRTQTVQPDGAGHYVVHFVPPAVATSVSVTYVAGPSPFANPQHTFAGLDAGVNSLPFDVALAGRAVSVSGTLRNKGVPITTLTSVFTRNSDFSPSAGPTLSITPDSGGHYASTFIVSALWDKVEIGTKFGVFDNDLVFQTFTGLHVGANTPVVFDDDYEPTAVHLTGTITKDGALLATGTNVSVQLTWNQRFTDPVGNFAQVRTVTVVTTTGGGYTVDAIGPRLANDVLVRIQVGASSADHPNTTVTGLAPGAVTPKTFDAVYNSTLLHMHGTMTYRGVAVTSETIDISARNAANQTIGGVITKSVILTAGAFDTTISLPQGSESVTATVRLGTSGAAWATFTRIIDTTPEALTEDTTWAIATTSIEIAGTIIGPEGPWAFQEADLRVTALAGSTELDQFTHTEFTNGSGGYSDELFLPPGTTSVFVEPQLPGASPVTLQPITAVGVTTFSNVSFETLGGTRVQATLTLTIEGQSLFGNAPDAQLIGYTADDVDGPFNVAEVSRRDIALEAVDGTDDFLLDDIVDADARFAVVEVTFHVEGFVYTYRRAFDLRSASLMQPYSIVIDHNANRLQFTGSSAVHNPDESGTTFCTYEGATSFPVHTVVEAVFPISSGRPNEVIADTFVFADGIGSQYDSEDWDLTSTAIPDGATSIEIHQFTDDLFEPYYVSVDDLIRFDIAAHDPGLQFWGHPVVASCTGEDLG